MNRIKIPQNVEREDRIVGPLTVRQFLFALAGAAVIYLVFQLWNTGALPTYIFLPLEVVALALALLFVFFKFNDKNFAQFLVIAFQHSVRPKTYLWQKDNEFLRAKDQVSSRELRALSLQQKKQAEKEKEEKSRLEKLSQILQLGGKISHDTDELTTRNIGQFGMEAGREPADTSIEDVLQEEG